MTHELEALKHWPPGDTRVLQFKVLDEDAAAADARKDITNATITWELKSASGDVLASSTNADVSVSITDALKGEFEITVDKDATSSISGRVREIVTMVDQTGKQTTWSGRATLSDA